MDELVLRPSKKKTGGFLVLSAGFVFVAVAIERPSVIRILTIGFFGLGVAVFAITMLPNASWLKLTKAGFVTRSLFRTGTVVPWHGVQQQLKCFPESHRSCCFPFVVAETNYHEIV